MKRLFVTLMLLVVVATPVQALIVSPDIVFTVRDDEPTDGIPDRSSVLPIGIFNGFVTNDEFIDETFIEFAVGTENVASATFNVEMFIFDLIGLEKTVDISSYNNGNGSVQLDLFGTGDYLTTADVNGSATRTTVLNFITLDVSTLYNNAVAANDDFFGIRVHNVVAIDGGVPQAFYNDSSLILSEVPLPAAAWLFATALIGLIGIGRRKAA